MSDLAVKYFTTKIAFSRYRNASIHVEGLAIKTISLGKNNKHVLG